MGRAGRYLSPEQAAAVYNRIGRWQDTQAWYERPAVDLLVRAGEFEAASRVVEVGCGTGALAARLLNDRLPPTARYLGLDVSPRMVALSRNRLRRWADRVEVMRIDGRGPWPVPDHTADRVLATYLLDLLAPAAIEAFFAEAARVLRPGGLAATVSLSADGRGISRLVSAGWLRLWRVNPHLTGGCRPVDPSALLPGGWKIRRTALVTSFGIPSTVMVAAPAATG